MPGWQEDTSQCRTFEELPVNARSYVEKIEELIDVPGIVQCMNSIINHLSFSILNMDSVTKSDP